MDSITVKNFRCFGEEQTVPLAPLTLLVGENSTGKTSFLALIQELAWVGYGEVPPNFKRAPYDLGSFGEILHDPGDMSSRLESFEAGFTRNLDGGSGNHSDDNGRTIEFRARFENRQGVPFPVRRRLGDGTNWIEHSIGAEQQKDVIQSKAGDKTVDATVSGPRPGFGDDLLPLSFAARIAGHASVHTDDENGEENSEVEEILRRLVLDDFGQVSETRPPFASAPVRSRPSRTYDPADVFRDSEGEHTPTYLARMSMLGGVEWEKLQNRLIDSGRKSGLFDDLKIERFGDSEGSPFQIHVRKLGSGRDGQFRNLVDMGYGISQSLPILTELLRDDSPNAFLLQQPEVHLHPSAQAALGTLFCNVASSGKQIIVETHSEYIVDRIRMEIRDQKTDLQPEDVSVLYFERGENDVRIHPIRFDEMGNVMNAPDGYGKFFMDEVNRSLGI